jgi:hypothetical protein
MGQRARAGSDLWVFREGRRNVSGTRLLAELAAELGALAGAAGDAARRRIAESALLRAGELESLLADRDSLEARAIAGLTDQLAALFVGSQTNLPPAARAACAACGADLGADAKVSPPEGFAYYALQPSAFARALDGLAIPSGAAAVIGLRSIGTTLSAVVAAELRRRGIDASRTTVRPVGHPYDREVRLGPGQVAWMRARRDRGAAFFVADEGPGMSGSSLLAAAEAVARAGVDPRTITFVCSRAVDEASLLARDAAQRFAAFAGKLVAPPAPPPEEGASDVAGGVWRARFCADEASWPASWIGMERAKFVSADGKRLFKFEGLGRWGAAVRERAEAIAAAGFGARVEDAGGGFAAYEVIDGRPLGRAEIACSALVDRLAAYCAFRAAVFPAPDADTRELAEMARHNEEQLTGRARELDLAIERPVIADGRLHPHEWILARDGRVLKVDAAAHGDDHGFPGPTDIAWDLASAVVDWELEGAARAALCARYARLSGDRVEARLAAFERAYLLAQAARCKMAAGSLAGSAEASRLTREYGRYRRMLARLDRGRAEEGRT